MKKSEGIMPPRIKYYFDQFVSAANMSCPHPNDQERFYQFIWACRLGRSKITEGEVVALLIKAGFQEELSDSYGNAYYHCQRFLEKNIRYSVVRWLRDQEKK